MTNYTEPIDAIAPSDSNCPGCGVEIEKGADCIHCTGSQGNGYYCLECGIEYLNAFVLEREALK